VKPLLLGVVLAVVGFVGQARADCVESCGSRASGCLSSCKANSCIQRCMSQQESCMSMCTQSAAPKANKMKCVDATGKSVDCGAGGGLPSRAKVKSGK
jgi:hypothetical protein